MSINVLLLLAMVVEMIEIEMAVEMVVITVIIKKMAVIRITKKKYTWCLLNIYYVSAPIVSPLHVTTCSVLTMTLKA